LQDKAQWNTDKTRNRQKTGAVSVG